MATVTTWGPLVRIAGVPHRFIDGRLLPVIAGGAPAVLSIEQLQERQREIRSRIQEIDTEYAGQALPEESRSEWNTLNEELESNEVLIGELQARSARLAELAEDPSRREEPSFATPRPGSTRGEDIWDLSTVRMHATNPEMATRELNDRARRAVEGAQFPHERADRARIQAHLERLLSVADDAQGSLARHILVTGSPTYQRAFGKALLGRPLSADEQRALSLTTTEGGFAVPYTLDPTIIPTSNSSVNPYRAISRVETLVGSNEWRGVSSAGVTATRRAEGAETTDAAPTLAQPTAIVTKVDVFIPFSMEIGEDWGALQAEMARLIQDAKDDEEATSFTTGVGTTVFPQGVIVGATNTVTAGGTAAFAVADVYKLWEALPARFRPRASYVANLFAYDKIRQFDTAGGASIWIQNLQQGAQGAAPRDANVGATLLGRPAYEATAMAAALTTGQKIMVVGDFGLFLIVDRIGLSVEIVPHLFHVDNNRPSGQRGLYAHWRNTSKVLSAAAFRVLVTG